MRTVKEPTVRKQEILDGAIRVFAKYGYEKATISTIAKELKISQGLCYRYFPSKEDIYRAAVEKYTDMILEGYRSAWQEEKPIREWIGGISDSFGRLAEVETRDENLYALFHGSNSEQLHKDLMLRGAEKILPHIQEILRKAVEQGEIRLENPDGVAIIGLYGELGTLFTKGLTQEERMATIRMGWERLLGL